MCKVLMEDISTQILGFKHFSLSPKCIGFNFATYTEIKHHVFPFYKWAHIFM